MGSWRRLLLAALAAPAFMASAATAQVTTTTPIFEIEIRETAGRGEALRSFWGARDHMQPGSMTVAFGARADMSNSGGVAYGLGWAETRLAGRSDRVGLWAGAFAGIANTARMDPTEARALGARTSDGDFGAIVVMAGPQIAVRMQEKMELRMRAVFGTEGFAPAMTMQFGYRF
ncbi:MAG: hypothetical protein AAGE18_19475 [Pseudomonadota bacterium]